MERIVLGYDGGAASVAALEWVAARAARAATSVDVVAVSSARPADRSAMLDRLGDAETHVRDRAPGTSIALHRLEGAPAGALVEFAGDADLLVVGITPGHPIRAALAGAVPLRLSARSRAPVAMIPAGWVACDDPMTVGIADDGSSDAALAFSVREARASAVSVRLVHSWLMPTPSFSDDGMVVPTPEIVEAAHRAMLDDARGHAHSLDPGLVVHTELVRDSRAAALLRFAARSSAVTIGTHHRGLLAGSILGSVAQDVLWHAECPVIVVPESAVEAPER